VLRLQRSIVPFHGTVFRGLALPREDTLLPLPKVIVKIANLMLRKPNKRSRTASRLMRPMASA
jgi:hypothetical protein